MSHSGPQRKFKLVAQGGGWNGQHYSKDELMESDDLEDIYEFIGMKLGMHSERGD